VLVGGGGMLVDSIRQWDQAHQMGEERSHQLAMDGLGITARFLSQIVDSGCLCRSEEDLIAAWQNQNVPILDSAHWFAEDRTFPWTWDVTSDSLAARLSQQLGAESLILVKTAPISGCSVQTAADRGLVDAHFLTQTALFSTNRCRLLWCELTADPISITEIDMRFD